MINIIDVEELNPIKTESIIDVRDIIGKVVKKKNQISQRKMIMKKKKRF